MSFSGKLWVLVLSGAIAIYAVIGGLPMVGGLLSTSAQQPVNDATAQLRIVESVLRHIQNDYVDDPNMEKVRIGALRGLAGGLDPYSSYLTADQVKAFNGTAPLNKVGIGAEFSQMSGFLYVISAVNSSPAEKAGIRSGDVIEYIDGKATRDLSLYDARQLLLGDPGTTVELRVLRSRERPQSIKVQRGVSTRTKTEVRVEGGKIGIVKVHGLESGTHNEIRDILSNLAKQNISKVILDLRGVATGPLTEGAAVANLLIRDGELAKVIGRDNTVLTSLAADPVKHLYSGDLSVLIDNGTAGAAEAIAAAVLDRKRGEVIGERSFGAGTEQKLFPLRGGDGLLLTVAKWASSAGTPFLTEERATMGVKPTVEVKRPDTPEPLELEQLVDQEETDEPQATPAPTVKPIKSDPVEDVQLKKAIELMQPKASTATN